MNKLLQNLFAILFPFFPLLAWAYHFVTEKPIELALNVLLMPVAVYLLTSSKKAMPKYLIFFIIFTCYHLASVLINDTIPAGTNSIYFLLSDLNLFACTLFIIIENTIFEEKFISRMNRNIFIIIVLTLVVSLIQIKNPEFLFNVRLLEGDELEFWGDEVRNTAFYSWVSTNSIGITFPILIAIALSFYDTKKMLFPLLILSGIIVSFLTKSRYVMLSVIIVFSQLFFATTKSLMKKVSLVFVFGASIFLIIYAADAAGFDIDEVISSRILEKDTDMNSAKARVTSYEVFLIKFPENPWLGVGPKTRSDVIALLNGEAPLIHIGYLSYLYFYGIIGCSFLFIAIYYLLKNAWVVGKKYNFWGSFYGLITFFVANTTLVYFIFSEMGIVLAVIYLRYYNLNSEIRSDSDGIE